MKDYRKLYEKQKEIYVLCTTYISDPQRMLFDDLRTKFYKLESELAALEKEPKPDTSQVEQTAEEILDGCVAMITLKQKWYSRNTVIEAMHEYTSQTKQVEQEEGRKTSWRDFTMTDEIN